MKYASTFSIGMPIYESGSPLIVAYSPKEVSLPALYRESRQCVICSTTTTFTCVDERHYIDEVDLDSRPYELSLVALPHWIHACGGCQYRSRDTRHAPDNTADILRSTPYQGILADTSYPYMTREYRAAAHIARIKHRFADAAWYQLRAVWKCEDITHPFANLCRKETVQDLEQAIAHNQPLADDMVETLLITADILRRNGDMLHASHFNQRALDMGADHPLLDAIALQQTLIAGNVSKRHQRPA